MNAQCDLVHRFFDGELSRAEADAFDRHLGGCEACLGILHERTMLNALVEEHRDALKTANHRGPRRSSRLSLGRVIPVVASLAMAAGIFGLGVRTWKERSSVHAPEALALETEATRGVEARFSYSAADVYRPYSPHRGTTQAHDAVPMTALAALESAKEYRGVAAALVLSGEARRASDYLDKAEPSPDTISDRAAIAIDEGHPDEAIELLDPVLVKHPNHPQALWNQALAMNALHLPLVAAETWDKVAALGEPGWGTEAKTRAAELRAVYDAHRKAWQRLVDYSVDFVSDGEIPPADAVAENPTFFRNFLYRAMDAAASMDRVEALRPLARTLDGGDANGPLSRHLRTLTQAVLEARRPFASRYMDLARTGSDGDPRRTHALIEELRAAHLDDLFFSAVDRACVWGSYVADLERIAARRADPWMLLVAKRARAKAEEAAAHYETADDTLRGAIATCDSERLGYLCERLAYQRVFLLTSAFRVREADGVAVATFPRADAYFDGHNHSLRIALSTSAEMRGEYGLARAYAFDAMFREPELCEGREDAYELSAEGYLRALHPELAKRELLRAPPCNALFKEGVGTPFQRARELALLSRVGEELPETPHLLADLATARPAWNPGERIYADAIEGSLLLTSDRPRGMALLESSLNQARSLPFDANAAAALDWSTLALGWEAAQREDPAKVTALFADQAALPDSRCTLTIGNDYERFFSVARDGAGKFTSMVDAHQTQSPRPREKIASPETVAGLHGCDHVQVLASAPVFGMPELLPGDMAWSYRVAGARHAPPESVAPIRLVVSDVAFPEQLGLRPLTGPLSSTSNDVPTTWLRGAEATPANLLAALPSATEVQVHTHGLVDVGDSDAPVLVLSPGTDGKWALTAKDVATLDLRGHPIVVLAACEAARPSVAIHEHWSLASAFIHAGARAVIASAGALPDGVATEFFDSTLRRIRSGSQPAVALRDERIAWRERPDGRWVSSLLLFE